MSLARGLRVWVYFWQDLGPKFTMYGRSTTLLASLAVLIVSLGQFTVLGFSVNLFQRTGRLVHLIRSPDAYTYTTHNLGPNNEGEVSEQSLQFPITLLNEFCHTIVESQTLNHASWR